MLTMKASGRHAKNFCLVPAQLDHCSLQDCQDCIAMLSTRRARQLQPKSIFSLRRSTVLIKVNVLVAKNGNQSKPIFSRNYLFCNHDNQKHGESSGNVG